MKSGSSAGLVLGFQPVSQGFGWAAFSSPLSLYDWGLFHVKKRKNTQSLARLEKLLARLNPEAIVLEAYDHGAKRSDRVVRLCRSVVALAIEQRIDVAVYTREQIKACFGSVGASSRHEVAEAVARSFEALRPRLPKPRRAWDAPDRRMAIFDAAAATMAHFQINSSQVLRDMLSNGF
jgi:Holliday junction resolvasome RuvABC endonuclease subunit